MLKSFWQQVHFRSGIGGDSQITTTAYNIIADLDRLEGIVKDKAHNLEASLSQIDDYQKQIQDLRKRILQEEQQLRLIMAPTYLPGDREKAASEQQVRLHLSNAQLYSSSQLSLFNYVRYHNFLSLVIISQTFLELDRFHFYV